jgi:hypothetical protein
VNEGKESIISRFQQFVDGQITYRDIFGYINSSEFTRARKSLSPREDWYLSGTTQRIDYYDPNATEPATKWERWRRSSKELAGEAAYSHEQIVAEVKFFIRILRGEVSWLERAWHWWNIFR